MFTNSKLAKSIRLAMCFGAASSTVFASNVLAQEESEGVEKIEVTGSRIKQTDLEGATPVSIITREAMLATGITDVGDLIQRLPAMSGSPIGTTTNNGGSGAVQVNLRGLGSIRTLILINGRRVVEGNDFQAIPTAMIKRVEILKDGASAIYGADAVAGVVNIITRDDFEGLEFEYQVSEPFDTDQGIQHQFSIIAGTAFDGGNVVFGLEFTDQEEIFQGDTDTDFLNDSFFIIDGEGYDERGFVTAAQDPDNFTVVGLGSSRIPGGNFNLNNTSGSLTLDPSNFGGNGITTADQFRTYNGSIFDPNNDTYNYAPVNYLQTPFERYNAFAEANFEITDTILFNALIRFNQRSSAQELAPVPFDTQFDPGFAVNVLNEAGEVIGQQNGVSADNVYNPFGEDVIRARRRMVEAPRNFQQDITQVQAIMGLEGELSDTWFWDVTYNWGYRSGSFTDFGQYVGSRLELALGPSFFDDAGNAVCGTPDAPIAGCVPLNLFGGPDTVTQEQLDYVSATLVDTFQSELEMLTMGVTGEVEGFGAGPIGMAFGYEYRSEDTENAVDSGKATEAVTGNTGDVASGAYRVNSLFGEVFVPIIDDGDMTLDFTAGARYDDYSTFGSNTTWQGKLVFAPMDGLLLRATYGEVFREPNIGELFAPQSDGFPQGQDPCNDTNFGSLTADGQARCVAQGVPQGGYTQTDTQYRSRVGGNPNVQPEEGETMTVGVAWSPDFLEGFSVTVDYWDLELEQVIAALNPQTILEGCVEGGIDSLCGNISRFADGRINAVVSVTDNLNVRTAVGVDTEIKYNMETEIGDFNFAVIWTHLLEREDVVVGVTEDGSVGSVTIEKEGTYDFDDGEAFAENKVNASVDWIWEDLSVSYLIEYIDGINADVNFIDYNQYVGSQIYHDIAASYTFETNTRVTLGVTNLGDKAPPYIDAGFNGSTDPSTYRLFGRSWYLRLTQSF